VKNRAIGGCYAIANDLDHMKYSRSTTAISTFFSWRLCCRVLPFPRDSGARHVTQSAVVVSNTVSDAVAQGSGEREGALDVAYDGS
jgi:hypothetical protein